MDNLNLYVSEVETTCTSLVRVQDEELDYLGIHLNATKVSLKNSEHHLYLFESYSKFWTL